MATIGETLRAAREARGLSIEDVRNMTQIKAMQLEELENDDYSWFSAPVYAKGFLRLFARAVNLDPAAIARRFETEVGETGKKAQAAASGADADPIAQKGAGPRPPVPAEPVSQRQGSVPPPPPTAPPTADADAGSGTETGPEAKEPDLFSISANARGGAPTPPPPSEAPAAEAAPAPAHRAEKRVASTPLDFQRRLPPPPLPEKRLATQKPEALAPAQPESVRAAPRHELHPAEPVLKPVVKQAPVPQSALSPDARPSDSPVAPEPLPQDGPLFVFPAYRKPTEASRGDKEAAAPAADSPAAVAAAEPRPGFLARRVADFREWNEKRRAAAAARAAGMPIFEASPRRKAPPPPAADDESPFADPIQPESAHPRLSIPKALRRRHAYAAAAIVILLASAGILSRLSGGEGADPEPEDPMEEEAPERASPPPPAVAPEETAAAEPETGDEPSTALPAPEDPVPVLPPPPSFAK